MYIIISFFASLIALRISIKKYYKRISTSYLRQFTADELTGQYEEARQRVFTNIKKGKHAVLLLHGYSASPNTFKNLYSELEKTSIPYYAPLYTGFGLTDFHLLEKVKPSDWARDTLKAYDLLAAHYEEISVIGISNGGCLATILAAHRKIKHLILLAPNFFPTALDKKSKSVLLNKWVSPFLQLLCPYVCKGIKPGRVTHEDILDPQAALTSFNLPALPINSVKVLWEVQDLVQISKARYGSLHFLEGEQDLSVDMPPFFRHLDSLKMNYQRVTYPRSGHVITEDVEREMVAKDIIKILKNAEHALTK